MPDYEVSLSRTDPGTKQVYVKSVIVENVAKQQLATVTGIDELLKWCADEQQVPEAAFAYWSECKTNGGVQLYEILSELEGKWGITFTNVEKLKSSAPHREAGDTSNGDRRRPASPPPKMPDLRSMLTERLGLLQAQEKALLDERNRIVAEYEQVREDMQQTSQLLLTLGVAKKSRRKKDGEAAAAAN